MRKSILSVVLLLMLVVGTACASSIPGVRKTGGAGSAKTDNLEEVTESDKPAGEEADLTENNKLSEAAGDSESTGEVGDSAKLALVIPGLEENENDSRLLEARVQTESLGVPALIPDVDRQG